MRVYRVRFKKKKKSTQYHALSYTETDDKYLFHNTEDQSDTDSFVLKSEVSSVFDEGEYVPPKAYQIRYK